MKSATTKNPEPIVRVLKTGTCSSLSGKSKLTYNVGCTEKSEIYFRVFTNSNAGFFSREWVSLNTIQQVLAKVPNGTTITSFNLMPLFNGKSINTPCFLFAALKNEGLVEQSKVEKRCYESTDPKGFMSAIKALMGTAGAQKATGKSPKPEIKSPKPEIKPQKVAVKPQKVAVKPKQASPSKNAPAKVPPKKKGKVSTK